MINKKLIAIGGVVLLSLIWGFNYPFMKEALLFSSPATFATLRNFFGAIVEVDCVFNRLNSTESITVNVEGCGLEN